MANTARRHQPHARRRVERPFNGLTPAQAELFDLLQEECAEVILAIAKIKRHGLHSRFPGAIGCDNLDDLCKELGHVSAAATLLVQAGIISEELVELATNAKLNSIGQWLHHNDVPPRSREQY